MVTDTDAGDLVVVDEEVVVAVVVEGGLVVVLREEVVTEAVGFVEVVAVVESGAVEVAGCEPEGTLPRWHAVSAKQHSTPAAAANERNLRFIVPPFLSRGVRR